MDYTVPQKFFKEHSNILCSIENAKNSQDNILVWGKEVHYHNETLKNAIEKIRSHSLKLEKSKSQIAVNELVFLGHVIPCNGIKADPKKVHAISNLPQPTKKTELQKFLEIYGNLLRRTMNLYLILLKLMLLIN